MVAAMKDPAEGYAMALDAAHDFGSIDGGTARAIADLFGLDLAFPRDVVRVMALMNRCGLVPARINLDGPWFDVDSLLQPSGSWNVWLFPVTAMPVWGGDDDAIVDLVAFAVDGRHQSRVWRYTGHCDAMGWRASDGGLDVFTSPFLWLKHWLARVGETTSLLFAAETGPEAFGALILDAKKMDWRLTPRQPADAVLASIEELRFRDSAALRDQVAKEWNRAQPTLPRLRAVKLTPSQENQNGPPRTAA